MKKLDTIALISEKYRLIAPELDEKGRRIWAATETLCLDHVSIETVSKATGLARNTIYKALEEIKIRRVSSCITLKNQEISRRVRKTGGGRKSVEVNSPEVMDSLQKIVESNISGDPMSPLRWTCKSTRKIAEELKAQGFSITHVTVVELLRKLGFTLQSNKKSKEVSSSPDRDAQFSFINETVKAFQNNKQPVISVDSKKKENIGEFKNNGKEWNPKGKPTEVLSHDFPDKEMGKATPYGIYDLNSNSGFVNVGISSDTAEFAVNSIKNWWKNMGCKSFPEASDLLVLADCGGSNSYLARLWKTELQKLCNETALKISIRHFPPVTSKWNKIEHRMFSYISMNWRGKPLTSIETVVNLIGDTTTRKGLRIECALDKNNYEKGKKISDEELHSINLFPEKEHGEWNYSIVPQKMENDHFIF